jgi:hypothetical protein
MRGPTALPQSPQYRDGIIGLSYRIHPTGHRGMRRSDPQSIAPVQVLSSDFDELADIQAGGVQRYAISETVAPHRIGAALTYARR